MKKLGLIGGTGPESTIEYYRQIEYGVQARAGIFPKMGMAGSIAMMLPFLWVPVSLLAVRQSSLMLVFCMRAT